MAAAELSGLDPVTVHMAAEIGVGAGSGVLAAAGEMGRLIFDHGGVIFPTPGPKEFAATLDAYRVMGEQPRRDLSDELIERALMTNGDIVNYPKDEGLRAKLAKTGGTRAWVTSAPYDTARKVQDVLERHEFESEVVTIAVPSTEPGRHDGHNRDVQLLLSKAFPSGALVYRRHLAYMALSEGPSSRPQRWTKSALYPSVLAT